jgi:hypothetical protein
VALVRPTACRYAVATSGSRILGAVGCDQHHRLVRPEQVTWVCKSCGPRFIARRLRRSWPVDRCTPRNAGRRTNDVARCASPVVGRPVARRRRTTPNAPHDAGRTQAAARGPLFVARCPHHAARHPSFVVRSPLFVVRWPKSCSRVYSIITRRLVALGSNDRPMCCRHETDGYSSNSLVAVSTIGLLGHASIALMSHLGITQRKPATAAVGPESSNMNRTPARSPSPTPPPRTTAAGRPSAQLPLAPRGLAPEAMPMVAWRLESPGPQGLLSIVTGRRVPPTVIGGDAIHSCVHSRRLPTISSAPHILTQPGLAPTAVPLPVIRGTLPVTTQRPSILVPSERGFAVPRAARSHS